MSVPEWLQQQVAEAEKNAAWAERRRGNQNGYWHRELKRRRAAAAAYEAAADNNDAEGQEQEE